MERKKGLGGEREACGFKQVPQCLKPPGTAPQIYHDGNSSVRDFLDGYYLLSEREIFSECIYVWK